jgi:hypothetical protein
MRPPGYDTNKLFPPHPLEDVAPSTQYTDPGGPREAGSVQAQTLRHADSLYRIVTSNLAPQAVDMYRSHLQRWPLRCNTYITMKKYAQSIVGRKTGLGGHLPFRQAYCQSKQLVASGWTVVVGVRFPGDLWPLLKAMISSYPPSVTSVMIAKMTSQQHLPSRA